jgi:hypothetical protein
MSVNASEHSAIAILYIRTVLAGVRVMGYFRLRTGSITAAAANIGEGIRETAATRPAYGPGRKSRLCPSSGARPGSELPGLMTKASHSVSAEPNIRLQYVTGREILGERKSSTKLGILRRKTLT